MPWYKSQEGGARQFWYYKIRFIVACSWTTLFFGNKQHSFNPPSSQHLLVSPPKESTTHKHILYNFRIRFLKEIPHYVYACTWRHFFYMRTARLAIDSFTSFSVWFFISFFLSFFNSRFIPAFELWVMVWSVLLLQSVWIVINEKTRTWALVSPKESEKNRQKWTENCILCYTIK